MLVRVRYKLHYQPLSIYVDSNAHHYLQYSTLNTLCDLSVKISLTSTIQSKIFTLLIFCKFKLYFKLDT